MSVYVGFYLDNESISDVDCSDVLTANPGIGGTEYMVVLISYLLSIRNNDIRVILFAPRKAKFPVGLTYEIVTDFSDALFRAQQQKLDYFIFKHLVTHIRDNSLSGVKNGLKLIPWCHVFQCYWEWDYYANNPAVYRILCVSREMMDLYRDHKGFEKTLYIYNCVEIENAKSRVNMSPYYRREHIVTYVGSVVPFKGLHLLTEAWPQIVSAVPDAELHIIGSGQLYDTNSSLGRYGIAEDNYEKILLRPILNEDGSILSNVYFHGLLGKEKEDILLKTKVGVPNPSGKTETFGISAVEMQMLGARVATIKCPGYLETVKNGCLYSNPSELAQCVIKLLLSGENEYNTTMDYFKDNFSVDSVIGRWEELLLTGDVQKEHKLYNKTYRLKFVKEFLRQCKKRLPILYKTPPLERIMLAVEKYLFGTHSYLEN